MGYTLNDEKHEHKDKIDKREYMKVDRRKKDVRKDKGS